MFLSKCGTGKYDTNLFCFAEKVRMREESDMVAVAVVPFYCLLYCLGGPRREICDVFNGNLWLVV